jgi:hypothetical protein
MTTPYTYLIKCPDDRVYYGVRYARNCDPSDLWVTYFTSSNRIRQLVEQYGRDSFKTEIRRTFKDAETAREWETRVLERMKVKHDRRWINVTTNRGLPAWVGDKNPSKRLEVRMKISEAKRGVARPDQAERMRQRTGEQRDDVSQKVSSTRKKMFKTGQLVHHGKGKKRPEISGSKHPRSGRPCPQLSEANQATYTCPRCGRVGKGPGMKRYHFDRCKQV